MCSPSHLVTTLECTATITQWKLAILNKEHLFKADACGSIYCTKFSTTAVAAGLFPVTRWLI